MMSERVKTVAGVRVPAFMYGTAWKEDATEALVREALAAGFRAIDTANQRKHYYEAGVGAALRRAFDDGTARREDVFLQTKFTFVDGQDDRLPYDPRAPIEEQVAQSFASSLDHLGVSAIDSYVLHGPSRRHGLGPDDHDAWRAMEAEQRAGRTKLLGISNVLPDQLEALCEYATMPPAFVQNRCYARFGWDEEVRAICDRRDIVYQGFSLLTANGRELSRPEVVAIARRQGRTVPQITFRFAMQLGMLPLTGTTSPAHMREDMEAFDFALTDEEVGTILG